MKNKRTPDRTRIYDLFYREPIKIGHWVGFRDLGPLHNDWLRAFLFGKDDQTLLAHRGSYKTTVLSLFLAEHSIIKPNENVLYFRKTDTDVREVNRTVKKIMESGCVRELTYRLYGRDLALVKNTDAEISTNLTTTPKGASQIVGLGIGTSITGKHADIVITDDIVNIKDRVSRTERETTKTAYMELQNIKNRGGRFINTGTPWHKQDAISMMPNVKRFSCYDTGLISPEELKRIRESMTDSLFAANYELRHIADSKALFKEPKWESERSLIYDGAGHVDAAYGGEDFTAYTIMKALPDGRIIAYGKLWGRHVDECLDEIASLHELYRAGSIACETNADKGYLAKSMQGIGLYPETYAETMNKYVKISGYLKKNWSRIYWLDETDPDYMAQVLEYSEFAEHDDAPDSAASLLRRILEAPTLDTGGYLIGGI